MCRPRSLVVATYLVLLTLLVPTTQAQITEFNWNGPVGAQDWNTASNWLPSGVPNDTQHVANLSVGLAGDLNVNFGGSDVILAGLGMGGTAGPVTTEVSSSGGLLRFQNDFSQDLANADFSRNGRVSGEDFLIWQRNLNAALQTNSNNGDADLSTVVDELDLAIWEQNYGLNRFGLNSGRPVLNTGTVLGGNNLISAGVRLMGETLEIVGRNNVTFDGPITIEESNEPLDRATASISNQSLDVTATINGDIALQNQFAKGAADEQGTDFNLTSNGLIIVNGVISDGGTSSDLSLSGTGTIRLNAANTFTGGAQAGAVNLEIGNDQALGTGRFTTSGVNIIAYGADRTISNFMMLSRGPTFSGENNVILAGTITQTNNEQLTNELPAGKELIIPGTVAIWGDDDVDPVREFTFDGTGLTRVTGNIQNLSDEILDEFPALEITSAGIRKEGSGVLVIDVAPGMNEHIGPTRVGGGTFHYANVGSLNVGSGKIVSRGGAIGIDTGLTNTTAGNEGSEFLGRIDSISTGGLMLAPSDAAATLNFNNSPLSNASNMTVAAPETGLTFTGTIIPSTDHDTYGLGGGTGTLTLPGAQLTGANSLEVRNGSTVELFGLNTYTGTTKVFRGAGMTLAVNTLADGGVASSIGAASSDAANVEIQGATLRYVGDGDSTNRLFTIGTAGATLDSSGTGAVVFSNSGAFGIKDASDLIGDVDDFTENNSPNVIYNVMGETRDVVAGMPISDPDPAMGFDFTQAPCEPDGSNCIPEGTVVTGVSAGGGSIGISNTYPFVSKLGTRLVLGTVDRTFRLTGSNTDANTIAGVIGDSAAGGVVHLTKSGSGTWVLTGNNTYSGDTTVEEGLLSITNPYLDDASTLDIDDDAILNLDFSATDIVGGLVLNGAAQADGLWGAIGNSAADFTTSLITGSGLLNVGGAALSTLAAVPEPSSLLLAALALLGLTHSRTRLVR